MEHENEFMCPKGHKFKSKDGVCPEHKVKGKKIEHEESLSLADTYRILHARIKV